MSEERFYRASVCGDEGLYDKEDGCIIVNVRSNIDLDDNWNTVVNLLNELAEENEQLKKQLELRTESDKYHQRMLMKWLCKDDGDGV